MTLEQAHGEYYAIQERRALCTSKEQTFLNNLEAVKISGASSSDILLLARVFDNNLLNGFGMIYRLGYQHGENAAKKRAKRRYSHLFLNGDMD